MCIKKISVFILVCMFAGVSTQAQQQQIPPVSTEAQDQISRLEFMTGTWVGKAWMMTPTGEKEEYDQTEIVQFKNEQTALLVEGRGMDGDRVIHDALAVIKFKEGNSYNFTSFLANGREGAFVAELIGEQTIQWHMNDFIRYTMTINEKGQWSEKGEMNREGNWIQFLGMTLDKVDD